MPPFGARAARNFQSGDEMPQNLKGAREESAFVLDLISRKTLPPPEQKKVIEESVRYWRENVNPSFLEYRKSVSTDYTAVEWSDEGAAFRDIQGKEFLDMLGGFGIYVTGHRHPKVLKAVREQLDKQAIHSQELIDPLRTYLAHLVAMITPGDLQYAFFTNSGTESVEACLKMAILTTGRHHFVGTLGAFHGKSLGSLGGTSKAVFREPFLPLTRSEWSSRAATSRATAWRPSSSSPSREREASTWRRRATSPPRARSATGT